MAILPINSGVTPNTLCLFLKLLNKFPSFDPISTTRSSFFIEKRFVHSSKVL